MRFLLLAAMLLLTACQSVPAPREATRQVIAPAVAVLAAADAAPQGVPGRFGFTVQRAEMVGPRLFLNSQPDYRDQRNLSISIEGSVLPALRQRHGEDLESALLYQPIEVEGVARRQRIEFTVYGRPSGKYYYQTHVSVSHPDQIRVVPTASR